MCLLVYNLFFFLMIRRPPRSTLFSLHDALPILPGGGRRHGAGAHPLCAVEVQGPAAHRLQPRDGRVRERSEEHTSELQSRQYLVCRLLLEKKKRAVARVPRASALRPPKIGTVRS